MTDDHKNNDKKHTKKAHNTSLSAQDIKLWKEMTSDIDAWKDDPYIKVDKAKKHTQAEEIDPYSEPQNTAPIPKVTTQPKINPAQGQEIDRRTADRLKRGQMAIEARIDLHGMSRDKAYAELMSFIRQSHARGLRCVLVISGKGKTGKLAKDSVWLGDGHSQEHGILRRMVPEWLAEEQMIASILKVQSAQPRDGGGGAFYVLLRRQRG